MRRWLTVLCGVLAGLYVVPAAPAAAQGFEGDKLRGSYWGIARGDGFSVAVGPGGAVAASMSGAPWRARKIKTGPLLLAVDTAAGGAVIAVGGYQGFAGGKSLIMRSTDRGKSFTSVSRGLGGTLYEVKFLTPDVGFAAGVGGTLLRTEDAGQTWKRVPTGTTERLWAVHFVDARLGFVGGGDTPWQNGNRRSGIIMRTVDGGATWTMVHVGNNRVSEFAFISDHIGFAGGVGGVLWRTRNGGHSWEAVGLTPLKAIINAMVFVSERCGLIVGAGGTAYVTRDGGRTWPVRISVTKGSFLEDLDELKAGAALVAAGDGTLGRIAFRDACE